MSDWAPREGKTWMRSIERRLTALDRARRTRLPTGMVVLNAASYDPPDWLRCNGAAVSRVNYAELFAAIGTQYGAGNGTTTFNLPNVASVGLVDYVIKT